MRTTERNETFKVTLAQFNAGSLGAPVDAIVTILDDDGAPPVGSIALSAAAYSVSEGAGSGDHNRDPDRRQRRGGQRHLLHRRRHRHVAATTTLPPAAPSPGPMATLPTRPLPCRSPSTRSPSGSVTFNVTLYRPDRRGDPGDAELGNGYHQRRCRRRQHQSGQLHAIPLPRLRPR